ncbi:hypothetical protein G5714_024708 [Onychostoma macrolepis]|uniref:Uncharacterized protein n=1 Tax=Onychostoma macrolepis TaxID=369639 RepID=A0A7J6BI32_9TELE|nr:hypothetical protein G5714_024708 [Onychostoma macrolepis]
MNATPQASYPCGNFSDTSCLKPKSQKDREAPPRSKPAARRRRGAAGGRPPGHPSRRRGEHRDGGPDAGRSWEIREKGPARRPESPPHRGRTPAAPPDAGAADTPDTPQPDATPAPRSRCLPERGPPTRTGGGKTPRGAGGAWRRTPETERRGAGRPPPSRCSAQPRRTSARPTQPLEPILIPVTDLTCRLPLRCLDLTRQRLFTLETCCGYGYGPARDLHLLPGFSRADESSPDAAEPLGASRAWPSLGRTHSRVPALHKEKRTLPGPRQLLRVRLCYQDWRPRACLRHSGFWDLNQTLRSAGATEAIASLPNGVAHPLDRLTHVQLLFTWNPSPLRPSKLSLEYLLLPPRSAPAAAPPGPRL